MRKKTSNQVQIASFSDSSCMKRRSKNCKSGTEESSFPHRAQSEERNTGGGGGGQQKQEESRLQDFGYGGRAESETGKARNKEPDGAHRTTTRNPVLVPSVLDDHVPPRPMLTRIHPQDFASSFPPTTRNPNLVRKVYPTWYFRPSVTTKLRPFFYLRGGLLIPPPQSFYFPIPTFPKQGFVFYLFIYYYYY
jgi:hypothetical protein